MSVKERIKQYAKYKHISIREFEKLSMLNYGYVNSIRVSIQPDKIKCIASHFQDLNIDWLLTGDGGMLKEESFSFTNETDFISYLKTQIEELKMENEDLKLKNERLSEQNGYYRGLLDNNGISYKQTAS